MEYITFDDVRNFILDRDAADNDLLMKQSFTDEEILQAMKSAAREYNSISPYVDSVTCSTLPADTNMFLNGTVAFLYSALRAKLMRNEVAYNSGGVGTETDRRQIENLSLLIKEHMEFFLAEAQRTKVIKNLNNAYAHF
jgi:hypothetical protein